MLSPAAVSSADDGGLLWLNESDLTLLDQIGSGSEGVAFKAKLAGRNGLVCAKANAQLFHSTYGIIVPGSPEHRHQLSELRTEARMLASLAHPNVLEYIGITMGTDGFPKHIVTELATSTLDKYWEDRPGSLTLEVLLHMCEDLFSGLEYLHHQDIVHGDVVLDNLFVATEDPETGRPFTVKLGMFGLLKWTSRHLPVDSIFTAPEVCTGTISAASDVFSAGIVISLLATRHLFASGYTHAPVGYIVDSAALLQACVDNLLVCCPTLVEVVMQCCSLLPEERLSATAALNLVRKARGSL